MLFPISRKKLFAIHWGSAFFSPDHLFYYPTLLATFVAGVLLPADGIPVGLALYLLLVVVVVSWAQAIISALQGVLNRRRTREVIGIVGFGLLVVMGLVPAAFSTIAEESSEEAVVGFLAALGEVAATLPPNLAAAGLVAVHEGESEVALRSLLWLVVWAGLGILLAHLAFTRIALRAREGGGGRAVVGEVEEESSFDITEALPFLPADVLAVASKELRYLLRSSVGKFNLAMVAVFVAIVAFILAPQLPRSPLGVEAEELALYGMLWYVVLFSNNFVNNSVGWEGTGFKIYLLSPVPYHRIVIGKNLGVWAFGGAMLAICLVAWSLMVGWPGISVLFGAVLFFAGAQVLFVTAGNFVSISFPVARDISSMKCTPAQTAILLSILTIVGIAVFGLLAVITPSLLGVPALRPLFLLVFFACAVLAYRLSLGPVAEHLGRRKDHIVEVLEGAVGD